MTQAALSASPTGDPSDVIPASTAINNHESAADQIYKFMDRPRSRSIDFNVKEEQTGTTILHEGQISLSLFIPHPMMTIPDALFPFRDPFLTAARRRDLHLIRLALSRGADVLARDRRNKMPIDVAKDEKVKSLLRQSKPFFGHFYPIYLFDQTFIISLPFFSCARPPPAATSEGRTLLAHAQRKTSMVEPTGLTASHSVSSALSAGPLVGLAQQPTLKGYLSKWTNMARGYHTRWLVLDNGRLMASFETYPTPS